MPAVPDAERIPGKALTCASVTALPQVYGPPSTAKSGGQHYGAYGLGPDACWFASLERGTAAGSGSGGGSGGRATDSWGAVSDAGMMQDIQDELRDRFRDWTLPQHMLDRDVAAMIRVRPLPSQCAAAVEVVHVNLGEHRWFLCTNTSVLPANVSRPC
jgi:hypothetical protein